MKKECVLYDRECINCGECDICDINPKKICDNCGKCIETGDDYNIMDVDLTVEDDSIPNNYHYDGEQDEAGDDTFFDEDFEEDEADEFEFEDTDEADDEDEDGDFEFDFGEFFGER